MKLVEWKDFINFVRIKRIDRPVAKKNVCSNEIFAAFRVALAWAERIRR